MPDDDVSVFYDGVWMHRIQSDYFADSGNFSYTRDMIKDWNKPAHLFDDPVELWFHAYRPQNGDTIVDIGAGNGSDIPTFSRAVGPTGRVVAIEAHPTTFSCLRKTCEWNRLTNVTLIQRAVADRNCTVFIDDSDAHVANAVSTTRTSTQRGEGIAASSLNDLCHELRLDHIDFLKMNIEGAEQLAIKGMDSIASRIRYICIACHDFMADMGGDSSWYRTRELVTKFLRASGFRVIERRSDLRPYVRDHIHGIREHSL
jgi:FkbM family methyltransferase